MDLLIKKPDDNIYCLFDNNDDNNRLIINTKKELQQLQQKAKEEVNITNINHKPFMELNMSFMRYIFIKYKETEFLVDLYTLNKIHYTKGENILKQLNKYKT